MTSRACLFAWFFGIAAVVSTGIAGADQSASGSPPSPPPPPSIEVVASQFADDVEGGKPVGDGKSANLVTYFVSVNNPGETSKVVLVWSHDGKETARQSLDVGHAPKWRTWGKAPARGAKSIEVQVLDAAGRELKKEALVHS